MTTPAEARECLDWAERQLRDCRLCPRQCRVNRLTGQTGWCGAGSDVRLFMEFVHYGEESELVPSHTMYLTGCNLDCVFCHTAEERSRLQSEPLTPGRFLEILARGRAEGARNVNILGGEPIVSLPGLIKLFAQMSEEKMPPLVWNSNFYCAEDTLDVIIRLAKFFLPDLKFGNSACAESLAKAGDYWDVVRERLQKVHRRSPESMIVRHLVIPGHQECCTGPILEWIAEALPGVKVSLNVDYLVTPRVRGDAALGRFLTTDESEPCLRRAQAMGLHLVTPGQPHDAETPSAKRTDSPQGQMPMDLEIVISPQGEVFFRHPTKEMMDVTRALAQRPAKQGEPS